MDTWKENLADYEFVHWDMDKISRIDNLFLRQALAVKKWAFAADYVRLYALYQDGGIYIDTDVEVCRSFDDLLDCKAFIGKENNYHVAHRRAFRYLTSHCMGAEPSHPFIKACLDYYKDRAFILSNEEWLPDTLKFDQTILPFIQTEIAKLFGYHPSEKVKGIQYIEKGVKILPQVYLDSTNITDKTYCRHLAMRSWSGADARRTSLNRNAKFNRILKSPLELFRELSGYVFFKKL